MSMSAKTFSEKLNTLVAEAIGDGCPLDAMILELTLCEHQAYERYSFYVKQAMMQQQAAKGIGTAKVVFGDSGLHHAKKTAQGIVDAAAGMVHDKHPQQSPLN